jgi:hypothetical protein
MPAKPITYGVDASLCQEKIILFAADNVICPVQDIDLRAISSPVGCTLKSTHKKVWKTGDESGARCKGAAGEGSSERRGI